MEMPFGKYRGQELEEIPRSYLRWVIENVDLWNDELRYAIEEILDDPIASERTPWTRTAHGGSSTGEQAHASKVETMGQELKAIVNRWWRRQAMANHPDRGGNTVVMQAINDAASELLEEITDLIERNE